MTGQNDSAGYSVEDVAVEHIRVGDTLSMSGDDDPRTHVIALIVLPCSRACAHRRYTDRAEVP
ncbi:hypothetical protein P3H80_06175 [Mycolicibacterium septicum]|uniref:hypothetical protein n=1 Tax=Mycolicibacterium septicum TaxID=98668 RepID=UPI0023E2CDE3|nr:hypothetical protein [Mycolicibacterium septicum]MDF3336995.1 hypothetical protein [Mycolicibacterium septicum]